MDTKYNIKQHEHEYQALDASVQTKCETSVGIFKIKNEVVIEEADDKYHALDASVQTKSEASIAIIKNEVVIGEADDTYDPRFTTKRKRRIHTGENR